MSKLSDAIQENRNKPQSKLGQAIQKARSGDTAPTTPSFIDNIPASILMETAKSMQADRDTAKAQTTGSGYVPVADLNREYREAQNNAVADVQSTPDYSKNAHRYAGLAPVTTKQPAEKNAHRYAGLAPVTTKQPAEKNAHRYAGLTDYATDEQKAQGEENREKWRDFFSDFGTMIEANTRDAFPVAVDNLDTFLSEKWAKLVGKDPAEVFENWDYDQQQKEAAQQYQVQKQQDALDGHSKLEQQILQAAGAGANMVNASVMWNMSGVPAAAGQFLAPWAAGLQTAEAGLGAGLGEKAIAAGTRALGNLGGVAAAEMQGTNIAISSQVLFREYNDLKAQGADETQATNAALMKAMAEYFSNKLFAGMPLENYQGEVGYVNQLVRMIASKMGASGAMEKFFAGGIGKVAEYGMDKVGEGLEEVVTAILDPIIDRITWNPNADMATIDEVLDEFSVGMLMSIMMGVGTGDFVEVLKPGNGFDNLSESDRDALLAVAEAVVSGSNVSNSMAEVILDSSTVAEYIASSANVEFTEDMTQSQRRAAIKNAVAVAAGKAGTVTPTAAETAQTGLQAAQTGNVERSTAIMVQDTQAVERFAATMGTVGQQALVGFYDEYTPATDYIDGMVAYYNAGLTGAAMDSVDVSRTAALNPYQAEAAYNAGRVDAQNGVANEAQTAYNDTTKITEGQNNVENESGSQEQQRTYGVSAEQRDRGVQSRARSAEARRAAQERSAAEVRSAVDAQGAQQVSTASLGVINGTERSAVKVVPTAVYTDEMKAISRYHASEGREVTFFTGHLEITEDGETFTARGATSEDGKHIWICADDADASVAEIAMHEEYHAKVAADPALRERVHQEILATHDEAELSAMVDAYILEYGFTGVDNDYILDEIFADAYAGIDIFDYTSTYEGATRFTGEARDAVLSQQEANNGENEQSRGGENRSTGDKGNSEVHERKRDAPAYSRGGGRNISQSRGEAFAYSERGEHERNGLNNIIAPAFLNDATWSDTFRGFTTDEITKFACNGYDGGSKLFSHIMQTSPEIRAAVNRAVAYANHSAVRVNAASGTSTEAPTVNDHGGKLTAAQQKYFANSAMRDSDGRLLVLYHGSGHGQFDTFDVKDGVWLTTDRSYAEHMAGENAGGDEHLYELYANIVRPLDIGEINGKLTDAKMRELSSLVDMPVGLLETIAKPGGDTLVCDLTRDSEFLDLVAAMDYDGLAATEGGVPTYCAICNANQVKLTDNKNPSAKSGMRYSRVRDEERALAPAFYSKAERIVEGMKQDKFGASSVASMLTGRGVKAEELKWLGLDTWLTGKKSVTKDELLGFIRDNSLQVVQDWLGDKEIPWSKEHTDKIAEYSEQHGEVMDALAAEWQRITGTEFRLPREANIDRFTIKRDLTELRSRAVSESDVGKRRDELKKRVKQIIADNDYFLFDRPSAAMLSIVHDADGFISRMDVDPEDAAVIREFAEAQNAAKELNASVAPLSEADTNRLLNLADEAHGWSVKITDVKSEHYAENAKHITKWKKYSTYGGENYREVLYRLPGSDYSNSAMREHWDERKGVLAHARIQDFQTERGKVLFIDEIQSDWHNDGHKFGYEDEAVNVDALYAKHAQLKQELYKLRSDRSVDAETRTKREDSLISRMSIIMDQIREVQSGMRAKNAPYKDNYTDFVLKNLLRTAAEDGYSGIAWTTAAMQAERWSDTYSEGYRIEYDQQIPGFLKKYGKQWGASISEITLNEGDDAVTVPYMAVTDSMRESVLYDGQPRFSRESTSLEELKTEAQRVKLTANRLAKQAEYWRGQTKLTTPETRSLRQGDVNKLARQLIEENHSTAKFKDVRDMLTDLGEYLLRGEPDSGEIVSAVVYEKSIDIATELVENAVMPDEFANIRSYVKDTKLTISAQDKADITDFNSWRKHNFGKIHLVNEGGVPVDTAYAELSEMAPGLFPEDITHPADQLQHIVDTLDSLDSIRTSYSLEAEEAVTYVADQVLDGIMSEDVRQTAPTFADRQAAKLKAKAAQAIQAERDKRHTAVENIKRHYAERDKRIAERRADSKLNARLLKVLHRLQNTKMPETNRAWFDENFGNFDTVASSITGRTIHSLEELEAAYLAEKENNPDFIADQATEKKLERLRKKSIAELNKQDKIEMLEALLNFENELRISKKLIDTEDRREVAMMGRDVVAHVEGSVGSKKGIKDATVNGVLTPERQARRITGYDDNDPLYKACVALSDGQRKAMDYEMRAGKGFERWTKDKAFCKSFSGKKAKAITVTGQGSDGPVTVKITPAMRVALYMHSLNSDNLLHIKEGGVTVPDWNDYVKGDLAEAYARGETIKLTPSAVQSIVAGMTEQERAFAQAMRRYFNEQSQPEINATSEKLKGYSIAQVENYFPINVNRYYSRSEKETMETVLQDTSIEGMGFLKERESGRNPILLRDADLVLQQSIKQHGKYVGLAIPVRNFNKLWNVTITNWDEDGNRVSFDNSVKAAVAKRWGEAGVSYMEKMVADLQGGTVKSKDAHGDWLAKMRSNYAGAVLTLNASVAIKQTTSYPTAAAVLGFGPLAKALGFKGKVDEALIAKYTPLLWYRTQGFSTQELGDMTSRGKSMPKALNWIQGMDLATTRTLWKASEYYVKDKRKDLQPGTDEFYREVARVYNRVIEETQPNYTTMQRGGVLRSDNELVKSLNMFKTQPFQNMNILYDAYDKLAAETRRYKSGTGSKEAYQEAKGNFAKAVASQIVSAFVFALMQFGWDAFRGRDKKYRNQDGDYTFGSWANGMGINMATNGFGMLPFGSELWELGTSIVDAFQDGRDADPIFDSTFYGLEVSILESITDTGKDIISMVNSLGGIFNGSKDWEDLARRAYSAGEDVLELLGKPVGNLKNMGVAIARWALIGSYGPILGEYKAVGIVYQPGSTKWKPQAYDLLFKAKNEDPAVYDAIYADMQKHGVSEDAIKAAMKARTKASAAFDEAKSGYLQQATASFNGFATFDQYKDAAQKTAQGKANELAGDYAAQKAMLATDPDYTLPKTFSWIEKADGGADVGLDPSEYILYKAALAVTDDGNGNITNLECEAAIRMLTGLSDEERDYLWHSQGKKDKNKPAW